MSKLVRIAVIVAALSLSTGCASLQGNASGKIEHIVVIWLKDSGNAEARQKLIDRSKEFKQIPGVQDISVGPMLPSPRMGVDSTFDVALVITFKDEASLSAYEHDPIHQKAVKEVLVPLAAKFVIYDFEAR